MQANIFCKFSEKKILASVNSVSCVNKPYEEGIEKDHSKNITNDIFYMPCVHGLLELLFS